MNSKINIWQIIKDHLHSLRDEEATRIRTEDKLVFFGLPALATVLYWLFSGASPAGYQSRVDDVLVASFSVFAALLLNIQVFLLGAPRNHVLDKEKAGSAEDEILKRRKIEVERQFFEDLFANISYAILISATVVMFTLFSIFVSIDGHKMIRALQFFLVLNFFLTLLMVMKRIHYLFKGINRLKCQAGDESRS